MSKTPRVADASIHFGNQEPAGKVNSEYMDPQLEKTVARMRACVTSPNFSCVPASKLRFHPPFRDPLLGMLEESRAIWKFFDTHLIKTISLIEPSDSGPGLHRGTRSKEMSPGESAGIARGDSFGAFLGPFLGASEGPETLRAFPDLL
jgi:hypothetical protein